MTSICHSKFMFSPSRFRIHRKEERMIFCRACNDSVNSGCVDFKIRHSALITGSRRTIVQKTSKRSGFSSRGPQFVDLPQNGS